MTKTQNIIQHTRFSDFDIFLFRSGKHYSLYEKFGSHVEVVDGVSGVYFAVYAPAAREVQVIGNFNHWKGEDHRLFVRWDGSGIWEGFVPGLSYTDLYKYRIFSNLDSKVREKSDPYSLFFEVAPKTSGIVWDLAHKWKDQKWMEEREHYDAYASPVSIYEVHLGSWKKNLKEDRSLHYGELAVELVKYVKDMGYTHIELLPITEHPYYPSWGYLSTGFFAPTSRFGVPEEFMLFVDACHQNNIGVILDWVPAHFPADTSVLADFDGSSVYEHPNPQKGFHPDWNSLIFNFERPEIQSFLISSARFWLEKYHIDGLRVDAVASMIYLDYSRSEGQWQTNEYGGNEYFAAIDFLKKLNQACYEQQKGIMMIAEESTAFAGITNPVDRGGVGFGFKWMMGWMNDTLQYISRDPVHRQYHHNEISFSMAYAYSETYILPLSHDEVVHGKKSLINKIPGDKWQKFAGLRTLYAYMFAHPGHKLMFMGNEFAQTSEWNFNNQLDWGLLELAPHKGVHRLMKDLHRLYKKETPLYMDSFKPEGFQWIDHSDHKNSIIAFLRIDGKKLLLVVCNFTPSMHDKYILGVPKKGKWREILNTDDKKYWGAGNLNDKVRSTIEKESHGKKYSIELKIPPAATIILKYSTR